MRATLMCLAVFMMSSLAAGQEDVADMQADKLLDKARRLMASRSCAVRAWGAYIAGHHGLEDAIPELRGLLHSMAGKEDEKPHRKVARLEHYLCYAALDALIRLEARVPSHELLSLPGRFKTHAFLLLAGEPEENQGALLDLIRSSPTARECWTAVCNLLVPLKTPGITAFLLENLYLKVDLAVLDPGKFGGGAGGGVVSGDAWFSVPEEFPPITLYDLEERWRAGCILVADGDHPIYCRRRIVEPGKSAGSGSQGGRRKNNKYRMEFLARLAGVDVEELDFKPHRSERIEWTDAAAFKIDVSAIRTIAGKDFESFAAFFQSLGLLSPEEMDALKPSIEFDVHDLREDKSEELVGSKN